jgi:multidrug efflux pump subunit AcrA (membrane-fusion protein)
LTDDEGIAPALPKRPLQELTSEAPLPVNIDAEPIVDFWSSDTRQRQQQEEYEEQQRQLQLQREAQLLEQQQLAQQQQLEFERQQRQYEEQQKLAQEQLLRDQVQRQAQGRLAELERDILNMRGQYDKDQLMLEQYDKVCPPY